MDPVSQGILGSVAAQCLYPPRERQYALPIAWIGALAGMAADLDILIQSDSNPLLYIAYHRHFTHALAFIPIGALIVACGIYYLYFYKYLSFKRVYLYCLIGYATHSLLDACTTYGTSLLWPFSDVRVAWNIISVVDPAFSIPALLLAIMAARGRSKRFAFLALGWMVCYLGVGVIQHHRAESGGRALAEARGHPARELDVKPSFANLLVWKSVYEDAGCYYVDGVRAGVNIVAWEGESIERFDAVKHMPWLDVNSQQAKDIALFSHFSNGYTALWGDDGRSIADIRYSRFPDRIDPLWGIHIDPEKDLHAHVDYWVERPSVNRRNFVNLFNSLAGGSLAPRFRPAFSCLRK